MSKDVFEMCSNDFSWSHVFQAMASWFSAGSGGDVGLCCIREDESSEHRGKNLWGGSLMWGFSVGITMP